jgi:pimeloyl-ACP methyl ester carboxylesterase
MPISRIFALSLIVVVLANSNFLVDNAMGDEPQKEPSKEASTRWNLAVKTAGGTQLWTDHLYRGDYRIQQNALTGHWRLLDSANIRRAWGTRSQCNTALSKLAPAAEASVSVEPKHVVVLLHGLMRTRSSMAPLEETLHGAGFSDVIRFSYASSRTSIGDHAVALREVMDGFPKETQFSFVGHSMGNIVVRHLVGDLQKDDPTELLDRCKSMVMLGPPNQGASIARRLAPTGLYEIVTGKGGMELGPQWNDFVNHLATPTFPFAIIAGDVSTNRLQNPLVDGASDFVVSVDEAKLEGCESFQTVSVLHERRICNENDDRFSSFA